MSRFISKALLVGVIAASCAPTSLASAAVAPKPPTICQKAYGVRASVVHKHGKRAPGRNICRFGVTTKYGTRDATTRERARYLRALRALNGTSYLLSAGPPSIPPAGTLTPVAGGTLAAIAQCESGGVPSTDTGNGFYGKYQFTLDTWQAVGGSGNPAHASEAEQDARAAKLYATAGPGQWPVCGR